MRNLALLSLLLFVACTLDSDTPIGDRDVAVAIDGCDADTAAHVRAGIKSFRWHEAQSGETPEFTVYCMDASDPRHAGEYVNGASYITIAVRGEAAQGVTEHESIHWLIYHGPNPELALFHVCDWPYAEPAPPNCYPDEREAHAVMSPMVEDYPITTLQPVDRRFVKWGLKKRSDSPDGGI